MSYSIYGTLKASLTIKQVCKTLRLPIEINDGYQECPFCQGSKKFRVNGPYYKCFNPNCNKKGDVVTWLVDTKTASNVSESIRMLSSMIGISKGRQWRERLDTLQTAFQLYKQADLTIANRILKSRGLEKALSSIDYGYAPSYFYLQNAGMRVADLETAGLIHKNSDKAEFFSDRIMFPIYNEEGQLVHLQGRACNPEVELRWLSTSSHETTASIDKFLFNSRVLHYESKGVFLCEGISDCLSLIEMELPAIACFGVNVDLARHSHLFRNKENIIFVIDSDRYELGTKNSGNYKSWNSMINSIIDLKTAVPEITITCMMVPSEVGKDINDWLLSGAEKQDVLRHLDTKSKSLVDFCFSLEEETNFDIKTLCKVVKLSSDDEAIKKLNHLITRRCSSPAEFIVNHLI